MKFRDVLVPIDFSDGSINALRLAVDLLGEGPARITLMHAGLMPYTLGIGEVGGTAGDLYVQLSERASTEQRERLEALARAEIGAALEYAIAVREGYAPKEILDQVAEGGHDLVVMGTHGRTGLSYVLLGSVAERVLHECPVPVLVTR